MKYKYLLSFLLLAACKGEKTEVKKPFSINVNDASFPVIYGNTFLPRPAKDYVLPEPYLLLYNKFTKVYRIGVECPGEDSGDIYRYAYLRQCNGEYTRPNARVRIFNDCAAADFKDSASAKGALKYMFEQTEEAKKPYAFEPVH